MIVIAIQHLIFICAITSVELRRRLFDNRLRKHKSKYNVVDVTSQGYPVIASLKVLNKNHYIH